AADAGVEFEALLVAPELVQAEAVTGFVAEQRRRVVRVARLSAELFTRISSREGPTGLAAIVRTWRTGLPDLTVPPDAIFVALHEVANPGNLGTIIRTAEAAGVAGMILIGHTADPYDPVAVKASMGSLFHLPVATAATAEELFAWAGA